MKEKFYKMALRPDMMHGLETVALTKRQAAELEAPELKMLKIFIGRNQNGLD